MAQMMQHMGIESLDPMYTTNSPSPLLQRLRGSGDVILPMPLSHVVTSTGAGQDGTITRERGPDRRRVELPTRMPELLDYIPMELEPTGNYAYINEVLRSGADGQAHTAAVRAEKSDDAEALFDDVRGDSGNPDDPCAYDRHV